MWGTFYAGRGDGHNAEIVRTIKTLAGNLGLEVIAEGVETLDQLRHLSALGCEYGQGYLFSKPVDAEAAEALIAKRPDWSVGAFPRHGENAGPARAVVAHLRHRKKGQSRADAMARGRAPPGP